MRRPARRPIEIARARPATAGQWGAPSPRRGGEGPSRAVSALLLGVLGLLLAAGLARMAVDSMTVSAAPVATVPHDHSSHPHAAAPGDKEAGAASGERCAAQGLIPVGDTGLCTHGPDPEPAGVGAAGEGEFVPAGFASPVTCEGDGVSGLRVEVIYARPADKADSYAAYLGSFQQWAADADQIYQDSAAKTGGSRAIRYVTTTPSGGSCAVVVRNVVLSAATGGSFDLTISELFQRGYSRIDRKYLIFMDADLLCGIGTMEEDGRRHGANQNNVGPSYSRVDAGCWGGYVAAHELGHNLGAVQDSAPNSSHGGHCVDEYDVMCYTDTPHFPQMRIECAPELTHELLLDCNDDDYFHTSPPVDSYLDTHWNVASSRYLIGASDRPVMPPPVNDGIGAALRASARPYIDVRSVGGATTQRGDPTHSCALEAGGGMEGSVWYVTRPGSSGTITVDTAGSGTDTMLGIFTGTSGALNEVACNDDRSSTNMEARVSFPATAGTTYHVMVTGWQYSPPDMLRLRLDGPRESTATEVTLSKDRSKFNGFVEATLQGFSPNRPVTLTWPEPYEITSGPNAGNLTDVLATGTTDGEGRATFAFRTPLEPFGDYDVRGQDDGGKTATARLRVIPRLMLNEDEGPRTTRLRVYFYGFAGGEQIEVRWHATGSVASSFQVIKRLTVAGTGRASAIVPIPSGTASGEHLVVGKVVDVGRSASIPFLVTGRAPSAEVTATPSPSPTPTPLATETPVATPASTSTPSPEPTPTAESTPTTEPTATETPAVPPTATAEPSSTETPTPEPTPPSEASPVA